jgi:hypothetical protein
VEEDTSLWRDLGDLVLPGESEKGILARKQDLREEYHTLFPRPRWEKKVLLQRTAKVLLLMTDASTRRLLQLHRRTTARQL